jgi:L-seryl-tRNA(Ser) seleniumtransferase
MEATLKLFLDPETLTKRHPVYRMFSLEIKNIEKRASRALRKVRKSAAPEVELNVEDGESQVGSGSVPVESLPTKLLSVRSSHVSSEDLARRLRRYSPPVFARVHKDFVLLDFRTIQVGEDDIVADAVLSALTD